MNAEGLRQRKLEKEAAEEQAKQEQQEDEPKGLLASLSVRVILILLSLFCVMHLFLWKVVYDFAMDTNHDRLQGSVRQAIDSLYVFLEHL